MGVSQQKRLDVVVTVDAKGYYDYPYKKKMEVANVITAINTMYKETAQNVLLLVPGRIGTSSPELGIPVKFSGISGFCGIVEMDYKASGYAPELSFGSHMFQDLVETEIFYTALYNVSEERVQKNRTLLSTQGEQLPLPEDYQQLSEMVKLYRFTRAKLMLYYDIESGRVLCGIDPAGQEA